MCHSLVGPSIIQVKTVIAVPLKEIPRDSSLVKDIQATREELETLLDGLEDFSLPDDPDFSARVRLQRVGDAVRVAGDVELKVKLKCGRCLEFRELYVDSQMEYMLVSHSEWLEEGQQGASSNDDDEDGLALTAEDLDLHYFEGEDIELLNLLREAILLELPQYGVCPDDLRKECDKSYEANLGKEALKANEEAAIDPRWAKLMELKKKSN